MESDAIRSQSFEAYFADKTVQLVDGLKAHIPYSEATGEGADMSRVHKEIKSLRRGLPFYEENSIFVAADSAENVYMKALLAGSAGTPYAHGLFEFDIHLPEQYPHSPPQMTHKTSSRSGVGFGPNLYADGYVCLSLIGTWSGDDVESWSPDKNLLQVLVSIQCLVMEDNIISKEPGWETFPEDSTDNIIYQNIVKIATIRHAMIEPLQNPPLGFEDIIESYFRIKKECIIQSINKWLENAATQSIPYSYEDMAFAYNSSFYNQIAHEGYFKALRDTGNQLRTLLTDKFGEELPQLMHLPDEEVEKLKQQQASKGKKENSWEEIECWGNELVEENYGEYLVPENLNINQTQNEETPIPITKNLETAMKTLQHELETVNQAIKKTDSNCDLIEKPAELFPKQPTNEAENTEMNIDSDLFGYNIEYDTPKISVPQVNLTPGISNSQHVSIANLFSFEPPPQTEITMAEAKPESCSDKQEIEEEELGKEEIPILFKQPSSSDPQAPESTHEFSQALSHLRLSMVDLVNSTYIYAEDSISPQATARITKELKSLDRALPCEPSGSIFIAIDSSNMSKIRALISGNVDTPYEHGLFLFDIKLPQNYPDSPPLVSIVTTGEGTLRFNPNLYNTGFVCLSIINTWEGDDDEMWNPAYSTILQVLLSIQALVMDDEVIQKEPGFQQYSKDSKPNVDYSAIVQFGNIRYAMTQMIRNPPQEFKELIHCYFKFKKEDVLRTVASWVEGKREFEIDTSEYLLANHNRETINYFNEKTAYQAFEEAFQELKEALEAIQ